MPEGQPSRATADNTPALSTIYIVDDDAIVRDVIRGMIEDEGNAVEEFASCEDFIAAYRPGGQGCLIVDAGFPGMSGVELLLHLQAEGHQLPAIMITGNGDVDLAVAAMKAGASDFIEKPVTRIDLLGCVSRVLEKARSAGKRAVDTAWAASQIGGLTKRQRQVLTKILAGERNKNIAADIGISQRTVETHRAAIMKKAGVKSLPELVRMAYTADRAATPADAAKSPPADPILAVPTLAVTNLAEAVLPDTPHGAPAIAAVEESAQFERFFDQIPLAIIVSEMKAPERIAYANPEFERLTGLTAASVVGQPWSVLEGAPADSVPTAGKNLRPLGAAIAACEDYVGSFRLSHPAGGAVLVDAHSNLIEDDGGTPAFRLAALVETVERDAAPGKDGDLHIQEKDALLLEFQHRVKNNLQMITALIRVEAKNARGKLDSAPFERLAGRINSIQLLYKLLSGFATGGEIDLGVYLSEIVSSVMHAHAVEGIRLNLKLDTYPVSVNVAMPTGLVVNELMTNALKHAFVGRDGGAITLHSVADEVGWRVVVADDGIGLPEGAAWPKPGKLGALIVRSLREKAKADLKVDSSPETGTKVTISFTRAAAAPA